MLDSTRRSMRALEASLAAEAVTGTGQQTAANAMTAPAEPEVDPIEGGDLPSQRDSDIEEVESLRGWVSRSPRLHRWRAESAVVDTVLRLIDRHRAIAGTLLAGALGYRLFVVTLPLTLIAVGLLGFAEQTSATDPEAVTRTLGISGLMASAIRTSGEQAVHLRWFTLVGGVALLLWATWSLLRALRTMHAFAWRLPVARLRHPVPAVLLASSLMLLSTAVSGGVSDATAAWPFWALVANLALLTAYACVWLLLSWYMPHASGKWTTLLPGSVLFALGVKGLQLFTIYYAAPFLNQRVSVYGALGYASMALLMLYAFGELAVLSAVLNAVVAERRKDTSIASGADSAPHTATRPS